MLYIFLPSHGIHANCFDVQPSKIIRSTEFKSFNLLRQTSFKFGCKVNIKNQNFKILSLAAVLKKVKHSQKTTRIIHQVIIYYYFCNRNAEYLIITNKK